MGPCNEGVDVKHMKGMKSWDLVVREQQRTMLELGVFICFFLEDCVKLIVFQKIKGKT